VSDGRTGKRFPLQLPITIQSAPKKRKGTTANVSAAGVYIRGDAELKVGSRIQFEITLPAGVIGAEQDVRIQCRGRVVRSEANAVRKTRKTAAKAKRTGLACVIDHYKFVRAT
jgi:hypothetical protein